MRKIGPLHQGRHDDINPLPFQRRLDCCVLLGSDRPRHGKDDGMPDGTPERFLFLLDER